MITAREATTLMHCAKDDGEKRIASAKVCRHKVAVAAWHRTCDLLQQLIMTVGHPHTDCDRCVVGPIQFLDWPPLLPVLSKRYHATSLSKLVHSSDKNKNTPARTMGNRRGADPDEPSVDAKVQPEGDPLYTPESLGASRGRSKKRGPTVSPSTARTPPRDAKRARSGVIHRLANHPISSLQDATVVSNSPTRGTGDMEVTSASVPEASNRATDPKRKRSVSTSADAAHRSPLKSLRREQDVDTVEQKARTPRKSYADEAEKKFRSSSAAASAASKIQPFKPRVLTFSMPRTPNDAPRGMAQSITTATAAAAAARVSSRDSRSGSATDMTLHAQAGIGGADSQPVAERHSEKSSGSPSQTHGEGFYIERVQPRGTIPRCCTTHCGRVLKRRHLRVTQRYRYDGDGRKRQSTSLKSFCMENDAGEISVQCLPKKVRAKDVTVLVPDATADETVYIADFLTKLAEKRG